MYTFSLSIKKQFTISIIILAGLQSQAQLPHIKTYFNQPVNTSVSAGTDAVYLDGTMFDTLAAYIDRAKYTVDVAVYDYASSGAIAGAVNSAYLLRGVKVRWIYDASTDNSELSELSSGIHTLGRPVNNEGGIMHNKFVIIDANSTDPNDPVVWTGSMDFSTTMLTSDYNNTIIFQDAGLAQAYTSEFNQMWGSTTTIPDSANAKFGPAKAPTTQHSFTIDGATVNLYFSPTDGTDNQICNTINSATANVYFGMYTFTESTAADALKVRLDDNVSMQGIVDQYSEGSTAYTTLTPAMGSNLKTYAESNSIYHNKYLIVDPCGTTTNPQVLTGSHNWTESANEYNDENTVIVHSAAIANIYYQAWSKDFTSLGGTLADCAPQNSTVGINNISNNVSVNIYPNPSSSSWQLNVAGNWQGGWYELYDMSGELVSKSAINGAQSDIAASSIQQGVYIIKVYLADGNFVKKLTKL